MARESALRQHKPPPRKVLTPSESNKFNAAVDNPHPYPKPNLQQNLAGLLWTITLSVKFRQSRFIATCSRQKMQTEKQRSRKFTRCCIDDKV